MFTDSRRQLSSLFGLELLGIIDSVKLGVGWKTHRRGDHGPGQRSDADFVHPRDGADAGFPQNSLEIEHVLEPQSLGALLLVASFKNLAELAHALTRISTQFVQKLRADGLLPRETTLSD